MAPAQGGAAVTTKRNLERFIATTGKTEKEYYEWASQVGRQMHINNLDRLVCAKLGIYTVAHLPQLITDLPEGLYDEADIDEYLINNSENPLELAKMWCSYRNEARMYVSVESVLAEYLAPIRKEDFERWGDSNHLAEVSKSWFKKTATNLDVQIDEINEVAPIQVTIEAAIEFIKKWKPGTYKSPFQEALGRIEARFKEITTFRIKEYYAEHLIKSSMLVHATQTDEVPF